MIPANYPLTLYRGDTARWQILVWLDDDKTLPADLTDVAAKSEIRNRPGGSQIVDVPCTVSGNAIDMALDAAASGALPFDSAVWDLQLTYPSGDVTTILAGPVTVTPDVTDSTRAAAKVASS